MKRFAVIGNPIEHSLSPILHNWVFKTLNIQSEYDKIRVTEEELSEIILKIRNDTLDGINVTIPHKENILEFLDEINTRAETIGSVNCIIKSNSKIIGNNTDWYGFVVTNQVGVIDLQYVSASYMSYGFRLKNFTYFYGDQGDYLNVSHSQFRDISSSIFYNQFYLSQGALLTL